MIEFLVKMEFLLSQIVLIKSRNFLFVGLLTTSLLFNSCEKDNEFGIEINQTPIL